MRTGPHYVFDSNSLDFDYVEFVINRDTSFISHT